MEHKKLIACAVVSILFSAPVWVNAGEQMSGESKQTGTSMQSQTQNSGQNQLLSMQAKQIKGKSVVDAKGKEVGEVNNIVRNQMNNSVDAVVATGGLLGIGVKHIVIPIDQLSLQGDKIVLGSIGTEEQLKQLPKYEKSQYTDIEDSQKLADAIGTMGPSEQKQASFQQLDTNGDGYLSPQEAKSDQQLSDNWKRADQNKDNQVDRSEFSAFEMSTDEMTPSTEQENQ